jgi:hypothetical protein
MSKKKSTTFTIVDESAFKYPGVFTVGAVGSGPSVVAHPSLASMLSFLFYFHI